jgi:uncharacterized protein YcfJ
MRKSPRNKQHEPGRDPVSGNPAHPVATSAGAVAGGVAAGAAAGTVAGPLGTALGAAIGAVAGGLAGKGIAEMVDPTVEDAYWRENHRKAPYYAQGRDYDFYAPAYRVGYEGRVRYDGRSFDEVEADLAADYAHHGDETTWDEVRPATRAAWDRVDARVQSATRN